jgi:hypothetical protein
MRKSLQTAIIGIALVCANSAHATKLHVVLSTQIELSKQGDVCADKKVLLRKDDNETTMCVITGLGGSLQGEAEFASLSKDKLGNWQFHGHSCQPRLFFVVTCFRAQ